MKTDRTRVRRLPKRGRHDAGTIHAILDATLVGHLGIVEDGQPFVIPTLVARDGDTVLVHGSSASRTLRVMRGGAPVCLTATLTDALVLARAAFHHSINYRSVVILGTAREIEDEAAKAAALEIFTEKLLPGRWDDCRPPSRLELKGTAVFSLPLTEASAKLRTGPPGDDEEDYALGHWAGIVPLRTVAGAPEPDPGRRADVPVPGYLRARLSDAFA